MVQGQGMLWKLSRAHATFLKLLFPFLNAQTCRPWRTSRKSFWTWITQTRRSLQAGRRRSKCTTSKHGVGQISLCRELARKAFGCCGCIKSKTHRMGCALGNNFARVRDEYKACWFLLDAFFSAAVSLTAPMVRGEVRRVQADSSGFAGFVTGNSYTTPPPSPPHPPDTPNTTPTRPPHPAALFSGSEQHEQVLVEASYLLPPPTAGLVYCIYLGGWDLDVYTYVCIYIYSF